MVFGRKFYATAQKPFHSLGSCRARLFGLHVSVFDLNMEAESVCLLSSHTHYWCNSRTPCGMCRRYPTHQGNWFDLCVFIAMASHAVYAALRPCVRRTLWF